MINLKNNIGNRKRVSVYVWTAVIFIVGFQAYWLYANYTSQKNQFEQTLKTELRSYVLNNDTRMLLQDTDSIKVNVSDTVESLNSLIKGFNINVNLVKQDLTPINDSLAKMVIDSLLKASGVPESAERAAKKFFSDIKKSHPAMDFRLTEKVKGEKIEYPKNTDVRNGKVITEYSPLHIGDSYSLHIYNINTVIIAKMWGVIIISIIYLFISLGTVYILFKNIEKNRVLMETKDNFTNNMTHELKTPIATLSAAAEALYNYNFIDNKATAIEYIEIMMNDIKKMDKMTSTILTNARLNNNSLHLVKEKINLHDLVSDVLTSLKPRIETSEAKVSVNIDDSIYVNADKMHLGNVFTNLIDNSLKYSTEKPIITITAEVKNNTIRVTVNDNGIGIPTAYQKEIFKPYYRAYEGDQHNVKGFGIGLTYALEIVKRHNGNIKLLYSEVNIGSKFEVTLPLYHE